MTKEHLKKGAVVGHLHVEERFQKGTNYYYRCRCDCGEIVNVDASRLEHGLRTSCRCKGVYLEVGKTYGHLTIQKRLKRGIYEAKCSCGTKLIVTTHEVIHGYRTSCGCGSSPYRRKKRKDNSTGFRGVSINRKTGQFIAYIWAEGKNQYLGTYGTLEEAAKVRQTAEQELEQTGTCQQKRGKARC